jgi:4-diphosphocytidyl-2-C-methyl-D-erythritol kinase
MTKLLAPAKLTWYLEITAQRSDGYHLLRSEMTSLGLADRLDISDGDEVVYSGDVEGLTELNASTDTLVHRALRLVDRRARVHVEKHIPLGGGLGGGSSNAAAILRWAQMTDLARAATLGGDVPFCISGGRALVTGIGEIVNPRPADPTPVTLFLPDFGVNTAACYRAFDEMVRDGWQPSGRNHLLDPACRVEPRLRKLVDWIGGEVGEPVLAGSGSTVFVEGHHGVANTLTTSVGQVRVIETVTA